MEMKCHVDLALVAGAFSQHEHEPRSRLGRQSHIRSTIRQDQSSVKKFSHAERRFFERRVPARANEVSTTRIKSDENGI